MVPDGLTDVINRARPMALRETCAELPGGAAAAGAALRQIEQNRAGSHNVGTRNKAASRLRVAFWNAERGHSPAGAATLLQQAGIDLALLCELDNGVARTGQRHTARDIARHLAADYLYAVEFVELEDAAANTRGFHGNAILSRHAMADPLLIRFPEDDAWASGADRDRRLGGRIALATRMSLAGSCIVVATTHFESHAGPDVRANQMRILMEALESYADGRPILIGGDFNTRTRSKDALRSTAARQRLAREDPAIFTRPHTREPLFEIAARAGFNWVSCNLPRPTERETPEDNDRPRFRLDWFFARGLVCENPRNITAATAGHVSLSDHDAIAVDIRLPDSC